MHILSKRFNTSFYIGLHLLMAFGFICLSCTEKQHKEAFVLHGNFSGDQTEFLVLSYADKNNIGVADTLYVTNGKFKAEGVINGAVMVYLSGLKQSKEWTEENYVHFFVEPGFNEISLKEDEFKKAIVRGSKTQKQFVEIQEKTTPLFAEMNRLMVQRNSLMDRLNDTTEDRSELLRRINGITIAWEKTQKAEEKERLAWAWTHTDSYISAYWLDQWYFDSYPLDSARLFYNQLSNRVKRSLYGKSLLQKMENKLTSAKIGDKALPFTLETPSGGSIRFPDQEKKYVLLDFWASWCKPCRKANPSLRALHSDYKKNGLQIIGVSLDTDKDRWRGAILKDSINLWGQGILGDNKTSVLSFYDIETIPAYILIDKEGRLLERHASIDQLAPAIQSLFLKESYGARINKVANGQGATISGFMGRSNKDFHGYWQNIDSTTKGITKCKITFNDNRFKVQAWGSCSPKDCDWGETISKEFLQNVNKFQVTWDHGFAISAMELELIGNTLQITSRNTFKDNSDRPEKVLTEYFEKSKTE